MAKAKLHSDRVAIPSEVTKKADVTVDPTQPQDLNFSNLSAKVRAQFQRFEEDRKKKSQGRPKLQKSQDSNLANVESRKSTPLKGLSDVSASRGKKRGSNGEVLAKGASSKGRLAEDEDIVDPDVLQKEVFALGGTSDDISLINGIQSESELEDGGGTPSEHGAGMPRKDGLQKGMTNILKEIALAQGAANTHRHSISASEEEEEDEDTTVRNGLPAPLSATPSAGDARKATKSRPGQNNLSFQPCADWFNSSGPDVNQTKAPTFTLPRQSLEQLHEYARSLLDAENEAYRKSQQSQSAQNFYSTVIASGTLSDKVSALTLAVQEFPVHNVKALETLVGLAKKRSRAQAVDVLRALKDLFAQGSLLPSDRKLFTFTAHPQVLASFGKTKSWKTGDRLPEAVQPRHLISWAYESWLKDIYFDVLKTLEVWCNDEIEFAKSKAVSYVFELLKEKPEQEANLLRMLVNKLGDPIKKIASQTSYLIMQLMMAHPAMKETIVSAIEAEVLFRPGQSLHAKYYAIVTLNQTMLSKKEESLAGKLLDIYFGLFVGLLKPVEKEKSTSIILSGANAEGLNGAHRHRKTTKKVDVGGPVQEDELRDKFTSAILTGINRAYPYTSASQESLSNHLDALFKITHSANFNTSIQAMLLIQQLSALHQASHDRFYRTLYESLLDGRLITSSKQLLYLNLLFRSLKADINQKRVKAFAKRITQILTLHQPSFICGAFFLLKELETTFPSLSGLIDQAEDHDTDEETFHDVGEVDHPTAADSVRQLHHPNERETPKSYDGRKRDPEHSNAEYSCLWELLPFLAHYHPSVAVSADHLLRHAKLPGKPDLDLHTLIHFLDRFVYRNPKARSAKLRGSSIMQPLAASDSSNLLVSGVPFGQPRAPVNTTDFRNRKEEDVAAEDVFFHKYFNNLGREKARGKPKAPREADEASTADEGESEIWKAMMESAPDLEGADDIDDDVDDDIDDDIDMDDLDSYVEESWDETSRDLDDDDLYDDFEDEEDIDGGAERLVGTSSDALEAGFTHFDDESSNEGGLLLAGKRALESIKSKNPNKERRKRMKALPTFASANDYAKMLDNDEGEDIG